MKRTAKTLQFFSWTEANSEGSGSINVGSGEINNMNELDLSDAEALNLVSNIVDILNSGAHLSFNIRED